MSANTTPADKKDTKEKATRKRSVPAPSGPSLLVSVVDAATILGVSYTSFRDILAANTEAVPIVRFGRRQFVRRADLDVLIQRNLERLA